MASEGRVSLTRKGLRVPATLSNLVRIKQLLTVTPLAPDAGPGPPPKPFKAFVETAQAVYVPRFFDGVDLPAAAEEPHAEPSTRLIFEGDMRPAQVAVVEAGVQQAKEIGGGMLVLPTGCGKTVCALYIACALGVRTLVLAHKSFLLDQWAERIQQYVPTAKIGRIQQDKVDVEDKDIVLGMLQSISKRNYSAEVFQGFGLTVVDECHHISAPVFSRAMFTCTSKYMLGLSATPDRKDGLGPLGESPLMSWFLGPVISDLRGTAMPKGVCVRALYYHTASYDLPLPLMRGGAYINMAKVITGVTEDITRNQMIVDLLTELAGQGRKILCLSDRRAHCQALLAAFTLACPSKQGRLYLGGMKPIQLVEAAKEGDVLFASYGLASEGLDIPTLDTLVMSTPRSDVQQAVGRVLRGATDPLIIDIIDRVSVGFAQYKKRRAFYESSGFAVQRGHAQQQPEDEGCAFLDDDE